MVNPIKQSQVDAIKKYVEENPDRYNKMIVFGKSITEECKESDYLEVAIQMTNQKEADDDNALLDLFCKVDDITDGKFDLVILNSNNNSSNIMDLVSKGDIIYG